MRTVPSRTILWLALAGAWLALGAAPAGAATATINGSPLTVTASDRGSIQVSFTGSATGEFTPQPSEPAYAGLTAAVAPPSANALTVFSYTAGGGNLFTPASPAPTVTQNGNQFILTATFDGITGGTNPFVHVVEQIVYVNGSTDVAVSYSITNTIPVGASGMPLSGRFFESADLNVAGNDNGTGFFSASPIRQVGGVNPLGNGAAGLLEVTPWTAYQEGVLSVIQNIINSNSTTQPSFNNTVNPAVVDNAAGVQWNFSNLAQGSSTGESVVWHFARTTPLQLTAAQATQTVGNVATVSVTARNGDGSPLAGRPVRYSITGANPAASAVTTAADGTAAITWTGLKTGIDTVSAFVDLDGNGSRDVNTEPRSTATVTWAAAPPPPPPVPGKSVVVKVVSGQVFIKKPGGSRATGPAKGFVPLTGAANVPMGSQLDTSKGRVALTSAADTAGKKTQTSDFYDGIFQVKQAVPKKKPKKAKALTTDLILKGEISRSQCAPLKGARAAATSKKKKGPKSVLGKLWGNGKGKFRSNGTYSSATVRGTVWLTQDECDGTLTKVRRGTVSVRDFKRKKTITVKAGHSYLARAKRAAAKSHR